MKTVVLYHGTCYDGFGAAWAAWRKFGAEATYLPVVYGQPFPDVAWDCSLYILDFSYPRKVLDARTSDPSYCLGVTDFQVLDHHKTAQADLAGLPFATFDLAKSGAMLAWEFFHPDTEPPLFIRYIQDRDLWAFALEGSREFSAALRAYPMEFSVWDKLTPAHLIAEGRPILRFQAQQVDVMCQQATIKVIGAMAVPVVNATAFFSEVGERLLDLYPAAPFSAYYLDRADGKRQWGMRSRSGGWDVSEVAKLYCGGGHPGAAGFVTALDWLGDAGALTKEMALEADLVFMGGHARSASSAPSENPGITQGRTP